MDAIIEEIYEKIHAFGVKNSGKHPNWLYINHDHYYQIMSLQHIHSYAQIDQQFGKPKTILGMQYEIKKDLEEIEVQ